MNSFTYTQNSCYEKNFNFEFTINELVQHSKILYNDVADSDNLAKNEV